MNIKKYTSIKRLLSLLLVCSMVFTMVPAAATEYVADDDIIVDDIGAEEAEPHDPAEDEDTQEAELAGDTNDTNEPEDSILPANANTAAYQFAESAMTAEDIQTALDNGASEIVLDGTVDLGGTVLRIDHDVTFAAFGETAAIQQTTKRHMTIAGDLTVAFDNVVLDGGTTGGGIVVTKGNVTLENAIIRNCKGHYGGGIDASYDQAFVTMNGGELSNNTSEAGGGVYANHFIMNDGAISHNTASDSGGGIYINQGDFVMNGGKISNNTAISGGGAHISGTMTMNGGTITQNSAASGGGMYGQALFMHGGSITDNTVSYKGGGVCVNEALDLSGSGTIINNKHTNGANNNIDVDTFGTTTVSGDISKATYAITSQSAQYQQTVAVAANGNSLKAEDAAAFRCDNLAANEAAKFSVSGNTIVLDIEEASVVDNVYVSSTGNDNNPGTQEAPVATLTKAYELVSDNGAINILSDLSISTPVEFNLDKHVNINGINSPVLTYTGSSMTSETSAILRISSGTVNLSSLTLQMPEGYGRNGRILYVTGAQTNVSLGFVTLQNAYLAYGGGGLYIDNGATVYMQLSTVKNCRITNNMTAYGGGIYVADGQLLLEHVNIMDNRITTTQTSYESFGGGIAVSPKGKLVWIAVGENTITGNEAATAGGGIYIASGADVQFTAAQAITTITDNTANGKPNNLYLEDSDTFATIAATVTGAIGVTHGQADYGRIVATPFDRDYYEIAKSDAKAYYYDDGTYDIRLDSNGNLILWYFTVDVDIDGEGVTSENDADETPIGEDYNTKIIPDDGYELPDDIEVWVGDEKLGPDDYDYDPDTGELHIPGENIDDDIKIIINADKKHTVTVTAVNVLADCASGTVTAKDTLQIQFTAASRYALPETVSVTGNCTSYYDAATGLLTISNAQEDIAVTAHGADIWHTIYFDANDGVCALENMQIAQSQPTFTDLPTPTRTGYTFMGWFDRNDTDSEVRNGDTNYLTKDLYLVAKWSANTNVDYTVLHYTEYLSGGGMNPGYAEGAPTYMVDGRQYYLYETSEYHNGVADGSMTIADLTLDRIAYNGSNVLDGFIESAENTYTVTVAANGDNTYPLYYNRQEYTVTYDGNAADASVIDGTALHLKFGSVYGFSATATRSGYTFDGWYTDANGGKKITADDIVLIADNHILYAHWSANGDTKYTVRHMTQVLVNNLPVNVDDDYTVAAKQDDFTGTTGQTVDIYALAINGYKPRENNTYTLTILADGTAVAYLYYDLLATHITFDGNGGSDVGHGMTVYYGGTFGSLDTPTRTGYAFDGWYTSKSANSQLVIVGTGINEINPYPDTDTNMTLYAHWSPRAYQLDFELFGGSLSPADDYYVTYDAAAGSLPAAVRSGYHFTGWYYLPEGSAGERVYITNETIVTADNLILVSPDGSESVHTLYADYTPIQITITFDAAPGTVAEDEETLTYTFNSAFGYFPTPSRTGYKSEGWYTDKNGTGTLMNTSDICALLEDITVYAYWIPNVYKVNLDVNGGHALEESFIFVTYDDIYRDLPENPTRTGYTFAGWFDGDQLYTADTKVTILDEQTLVAAWEPNDYTVTFDSNGGSAPNPSEKIVTYDAAYGTLPTSSRTGYRFSGWTDASGKTVTASSTVKTAENHTLTAKWTPLTFTVTLDANGGSCSVSTATVTYDSSYNLPTATRTNYTFDGWFTAKSGGDKVSGLVNILEDITVYAQWTANGGGNPGGGGGGGSTTYTITATADDGAKITPEGKTSISSGGKQEYTIKAEDGYTIEDILIDGESIGAVETYTFEKVTANHTIHVVTDSPLTTPNYPLTDEHIAYIAGYEDGTVRPGANITRAETAMIFYRLLTEEAKADAGSKSFSDVSGADWYGTAISTLAGAGIINGYTDGTFRPNNNITRAEFAAIAARFDSSSYSGSDLFTDIAGHWAANSINRAARKGWINGYPDSTFRPDNSITRAESVTLVNAVLDRHIDANGILPGMLTFSDNLNTAAWYYYAIQEAANGHDFTKDSDGVESWTSLH